MTEGNSIQTQEVKKCLFCQEEGIPCYSNLPDRLFDVPGLWDFWKCLKCDLIWLNPRPIAKDLGKTYINYLTHDEDGTKGRMEILQEKIALPLLFSNYLYGNNDNRLLSTILFGRLLSLIPPFNDVARRYIMNLHGDRKGKLLDVGCGNGKFLVDMKKLGWDVMGVESDPESAKIAKERFGLSVFVGTINEANFPQNTFDAITMEHVIEHTEDPIETIRECHRILKPGGKLSIATPNTESLQHRLFKSAWLELDPPRHIHLFSSSTLVKLFVSAIPSGFQIEDLRSISGNTGQMSVASRSIKRGGKWRMKRLSLWQMAESLMFWIVEEVVKLFLPKVGEEMLMTIIKYSPS